MTGEREALPLTTYLSLLTPFLFLQVAVTPLLSQSHPPDLIVTNAQVYTVDLAHPRAQALAITGDRITLVGSDAEVIALAGPATKRIDAGGHPLYPGFIDAHAHLRNLSLILSTLDLRGVPSYDSVVALVKARAREALPGSWIRGRGWDQNLWGTDFPTNAALSAATPDNPVYLRRVDGHAALVNKKALQLAGITRKTPDPAGGRIVRAADGEPTGVLIDGAFPLVERVIPDDPPDVRRATTLVAVTELNRVGLTGIHDPGIGPQELDTYQSLAWDGKFNLRDYLMIYAESDSSPFVRAQLALPPRIGIDNGHLWIRAIKIELDGALGIRGAALLDPYTDDPEEHRALQDRAGAIGVRRSARPSEPASR